MSADIIYQSRGALIAFLNEEIAPGSSITTGSWDEIGTYLSNTCAYGQLEPGYPVVESPYTWNTGGLLTGSEDDTSNIRFPGVQASHIINDSGFMNNQVAMWSNAAYAAPVAILTNAPALTFGVSSSLRALLRFDPSYDDTPSRGGQGVNAYMQIGSQHSGYCGEARTYYQASENGNGVTMEIRATDDGSPSPFPAGVVGTTSGHDLLLRTSNATRMTVGSAGNVGIGTTPDSTAALKLNGVLRCSLVSGPTVGGAGWYEAYYKPSTLDLGYTTSTKKTKANIKSYNDIGLAEIMALRTVSFTSKDDFDVEAIGFIAEEVAAVNPYLAGYGPDYAYDELGHIVTEEYTDDEGRLQEKQVILSDDLVPGGLSKLSFLVGLVNSVQELKAENDKLWERLELLENG